MCAGGISAPVDVDSGVVRFHSAITRRHRDACRWILGRCFSAPTGRSLRIERVIAKSAVAVAQQQPLVAQKEQFAAAT